MSSSSSEEMTGNLQTIRDRLEAFMDTQHMTTQQLLNHVTPTHPSAGLNGKSIIEALEDEWNAKFRPPTRQEIVQKMNYRHINYKGVATVFNCALRETLSEALTIPRDTSYAEHFNLVELTERCRTCDNFFGDNLQWPVLHGKLAAVRWLAEINREFADAEFPDMNTFVSE